MHSYIDVCDLVPICVLTTKIFHKKEGVWEVMSNITVGEKCPIVEEKR